MLTGIPIPKLQEDILGTTKNTAKTRNCILVQKDARTVVSDGTECYVNVSGNNGMATGGSWQQNRKVRMESWHLICWMV